MNYRDLLLSGNLSVADLLFEINDNFKRLTDHITNVEDDPVRKKHCRIPSDSKLVVYHIRLDCFSVSGPKDGEFFSKFEQSPQGIELLETASRYKVSPTKQEGYFDFACGDKYNNTISLVLSWFRQQPGFKMTCSNNDVFVEVYETETTLEHVVIESAKELLKPRRN